MATSKDVARLAGVSQATVSRAISYPQRVTEQTRARVQQAMKTLGYVPHTGAQTLRGGRTNTVGIVVSDLSNPFYPQVLEAITLELDGYGLRAIIWNASVDNHESALEAIRSRAVDGVIFVAATPGSQELRTAIQASSPIVLINRDVEGVECDRVIADNRTGARAVANFLVEHGRRDVVFISGNPETSTSLERERFFLERMAELGAGIPLHRQFCGNFEWDRSSALAFDLIESDDPPEAIFCANDFMALGALDALRRSKAAAAARCWTIGFDDIPMSEWAQNSLTTVHQQTRQMALRAVELLVSRIAEPLQPVRKEVFATELKVRLSTPIA